MRRIYKTTLSFPPDHRRSKRDIPMLDSDSSAAEILEIPIANSKLRERYRNSPRSTAVIHLRHFGHRHRIVQLAIAIYNYRETEKS